MFQFKIRYSSYILNDSVRTKLHFIIVNYRFFRTMMLLIWERYGSFFRFLIWFILMQFFYVDIKFGFNLVNFNTNNKLILKLLWQLNSIYLIPETIYTVYLSNIIYSFSHINIIWLLLLLLSYKVTTKLLLNNKNHIQSISSTAKFLLLSYK